MGRRVGALVVGAAVAGSVVVAAPGAAHAAPIAAPGAAPADPGAVQADPAAVPTPMVSRPPEASAPWNAAPVDLAAHDVTEQEYFFEGSTSIGPYRSRMLVRRPARARDFNGTVVVEWMNASSGFDIDVDFLPVLPLLERDGYAYVGVTAQQATVDFLANRDPARYGSLAMAEVQPAQPAAFEVFSQAGMALRRGDDGTGVDPLGGLDVERLIAIGQSQSSSRLTTYVDSVHGLTLEPVYDAFLPHAGGPAPTRFPAPVLKLNSENEAPGYFGQRGVSDRRYRYWEVPGSAHSANASTQYTIDLLTTVRGSFPRCPFPHEGPGGPANIDPVIRAAIVHLDSWVRTGDPPPRAPLIAMAASPTDPDVGVIRRDRFGNALGGIRLPQQEVPTGRNSPSFGCFAPEFGITLATFPQWDAFDGGADPAVDPTDTYAEPASARALYRSHGRYVARFVAATRAAERAGFILPADARRLGREAAASDIANEPT